MDNVIVNQIMQNLNITIVVALLIAGAIFKHWISWVNNKYIPIILIGLGIILSIVLQLPIHDGASVVMYIVQGMASGIAASVLHDKGKDIIQELFNKEEITKNVEDRVNSEVSKQLERLASIDFTDVDKKIDAEMGDKPDDEDKKTVDISKEINDITND